MINAIIGTAGHVDHGKTSLVKAITGTDTDRLAEEKKRGITIELGFASLSLPDGGRVGIVDVPGHEKFIKNMLAGACSMDIILLVIAADEGIMPQTREHLDILQLLKIKHGVIALTKIDMVDDAWLEMITEDIQAELSDSFLKSAKVMPVSSVTGDGVDALRKHLLELLYNTAETSVAANTQLPIDIRLPRKPRNAHENVSESGSISVRSNEPLRKSTREAAFRLPVDRVFTMDGFGTVVTGTLLEGEICVGDEITIYPGEKIARVRRLQVYGTKVQCAKPSQRVAVNLAQIKTDDISRGDVLATTNSMEATTTLDVRLELLPDTIRQVHNNSRVHLYHGTHDMLCRVTLVNASEILPGQVAYAKLHLSQPLAAKYGDPFVIRFYSPLETIGGGIIIDQNPAKARKNHNLESFEKKDIGTIPERIATFVQERTFPETALIEARYFHNTNFIAELNNLVDAGVIFVAGTRITHVDFIRNAGKRMQNVLSNYHNINPLHDGMQAVELRNQALNTLEEQFFDETIDLCQKLKLIKIIGTRIAHINFNKTVNEAQAKMHALVEDMIKKGGFAPPQIEEIETAVKDKKLCKQAIDNLISSGIIILLSSQIVMHHEHYSSARDIFATSASEGSVTLAQFRDRLGSSRKYVLAVLEHFDKTKFSKKVGDARVLV